MPGSRTLTALALAALSLLLAGCAFEGQLAVELSGDGPVQVKQSSTVFLTPSRVKGRTTRRNQVVKINCSVTGTFEVREATGTAVLVQTSAVRLRTRPLPKGTPYDFECAGPAIVQLPADAGDVRATARDESGTAAELAVQAPLTAVPIAAGKHLLAQSGTQFAVVTWPGASAGTYNMQLSFTLASARPFSEKVVYGALIACGHSKYVQPIRPLVTRMTQIPALSIQPDTTIVSTPHLFGGIRSYGEVTRTLSCAR